MFELNQMYWILFVIILDAILKEIASYKERISYQLKASKHKWVMSMLNIIGVNSLRLGVIL